MSRRVHIALMAVWALLLIPTLLWWRESIFWIVFMSWYAIFSGHWVGASTPDPPSLRSDPPRSDEPDSR